jgi:hypothetical protein
MKKLITLTLICGLPLLALAQKGDDQKGAAETVETTKPTAPTKETHTQTKATERTQPTTAAEVRENADVKPSTQGSTTTKESTHSDAAAGTNAPASASSTTHTTANKTEFRTRHSEVFGLGRHPKDYFVQRYGENHFRLIGSTYFVFVDNCWVAVDVDGFSYTERLICEGDPDYVVVD